MPLSSASSSARHVNLADQQRKSRSDEPCAHHRREPTEEHGGDATPIPLLAHIGPSIFVPFNAEDITPRKDHPTRVDRVKQALEGVEFNQRGVVANLHFLADHQRARLIQNFARHEQMTGPDSSGGIEIQPEDANAIIDKMRTEPSQDVDYNIRTDDFEMGTMFKGNPELADRRNTMRQLHEIVEYGVSRIEGYEQCHIAGIRRRWQDTLEKEQRAMEDLGRPMDP